MSRIVILGDSLSMPRPSDGILFEYTFPHLLHKEGYEVINRAGRANDTKRQIQVQNLKDDIQWLNPDCVVIYLGIVDCAPRIFTRTESILLNLFPHILKQKIINVASKYRYHITRYRKKTYVGSNEFKLNLELIAKEAKDICQNIIFINIANTNEVNEKKSFDFKRNISLYNQIIVEVSSKFDAELIDVNLIKDNCLLEDGIHINKKMHNFLSKEIIKRFKAKRTIEYSNGKI